MPTKPATDEPDHKAFPPAPEGIEIARTRIDPAMEAAQRAAQADHQRRTQGGTWADLPNGQSMLVTTQHFAPSYEVKALEAQMLARPELMLLRPKPPWRSGPRYQWRVYKASGPEQQRVANETARDLRAQRVRPVTKEEVNNDSPYALYDNFELEPDVVYNSLKLVEVMDERVVYAKYKAPQDEAIMNVSNLPQTVGSQPGTHDQRNAVAVKQMDVRQGG
jgi:hypothetical protein